MTGHGQRLEVLDGWRGVSITLVLAAHLLPLGPKGWFVNDSIGILGMVMFFNLSGFLITSFLLDEPTVPDFLVRRFFRVLPLACLYLTTALLIAGASFPIWRAHLLFYANLPPKLLVGVTEHMWSLCIEIQFYVGIAMMYAVGGRRSLMLLPLLALTCTALRVSEQMYFSTITWYRLDEILAGCTLALMYRSHRLGKPTCRRSGLFQWPLLILLVLSCLQQAGPLNYARPYLGALLIGATILNPDTALSLFLKSRVLLYLATISYSLYVIHPLLASSWLGSGDLLEKYAKRPLLLIALFTLAHISCFYYERWWINSGKKLSHKFGRAPRSAVRVDR